MEKRITLLVSCILTVISAYSSYNLTGSLDNFTYGFNSDETPYDGMNADVSLTGLSSNAVKIYVFPNAGSRREVRIPDKVQFTASYKKNNSSSYRYVTVNATVVRILPNVDKSATLPSFDYIKIPSTVNFINKDLYGLCGVKEMDIYGNQTSYDFLNSLKDVNGSKVTMTAYDCAKLDMANFESGALTILPNDINYDNSEYCFAEIDKNSENLTITFNHKGSVVTNQLTATFNGRKIEPLINNNKTVKFEIKGDGFHNGQIEVEFSDGENEWRLPFYIKGEEFSSGAFKYELDINNNTARLIGYTNELETGVSVSIPENLFIQLSTSGGCKIFKVIDITENALANSHIKTLIVPESVKTVGGSAFNTISSVVFMGALSDYTNLQNLGCKNLYFPAKEIIALDEANSIPSDFALFPTEIYLLDGTIYSFTKGLQLSFPSNSNILVKYGSQLINGIDQSYEKTEFIIKNSDCYPGSIVNVTIIDNDNVEQTIPIRLPKKDNWISLNTFDIKQCRFGISMSNSFSDELYGADVTGVRINQYGIDEYLEIEPEQLDKYIDYKEATIQNLVPGYTYELVPYGIYNGHKIYWEELAKTVKTNSIRLEYEVVDSYSRALMVKISVPNLDGTGVPIELGASMDVYSFNKQDETGITTIVYPEKDVCTWGSFWMYAKYDGGTVWQDCKSSFSLKLKAELICQSSTTGLNAWLINEDPYFEFTDENVVWKIDEKEYRGKGDHLYLQGLKPDATYVVEARIVKDSYGWETKLTSFSETVTTSELVLEPLPCEMASNTSAILKAKTNVDVSETGMGLEWRRYYAPDEMPSTFSPCAVSQDGMIAGKLNNLSSNTYYKFRPYYKDSEGTIHYSKDAKWIAFITADAYVYFEPIVYTYEAEGIGDDTVVLKGYSVAGSEEIIEQGFEYWEKATHKSSRKEAPSQGITRVTASGQQMTTAIKGLKSGTTYGYRSFVESAMGVTYGPELSFTTTGSPDSTTGIDDIIFDSSSDPHENEIDKIFNIQGVEMPALQNGLNIVIYKDGSVRKIVVK